MHDKGAGEIAAKITVVCIILLLLVVLFVIFLHLCAEWFLRRNNEEPPQPIPRHSRSLHGHNVVYLDLNPGEESMQMGLDPAVLRYIPIVIFEAKDFEDGLARAVCLSEVEPGEKARLLPYCNHGFHVDCIEMWLQSHSTCPLCRKSVAPRNVQSSGESSASFGYSSFSTNALFWGDETQVSINGYNNGGCSEDETSTTRSPPSSSSSSSSSSSASPQLAPQSSSLASSSSTDARQEQILAIDVPLQSSNGIAENESRSPTVTRWRSLKRLLMGKKRVPLKSYSNCVRV